MKIEKLGFKQSIIIILNGFFCGTQAISKWNIHLYLNVNKKDTLNWHFKTNENSIHNYSWDLVKCIHVT